MKEMVYSANRTKEVLHSGEYKGYKFCILSFGTHPTAYVEYNIENCDDSVEFFMNYYDKKLDNISLSSDGFTFFGKGFWDKENNTYLGWDYAGKNSKNKKWTTAEIFEEVKSVIDQLIDCH